MSDYGGLDKAALDRWITREPDENEEDEWPVTVTLNEQEAIFGPVTRRTFQVVDEEGLAWKLRAEDGSLRYVDKVDLARLVERGMAEVAY